MKKLFTLIAVTVSLAVFAPASSQAFDGHGHGPSRSFANNCGSCGTAVYRERTVIGRDRPGLVQRLASLVADHGGNWLESRMSRLGGEFAGILRLTVPLELRLDPTL